MSRNEAAFDTLLSIITGVRDAPTRLPFSATVETFDGQGRGLAAHAEVNFNMRTWRLREDGTEISFSPETGWTIRDSGTTELVPRERDDWLPQGLGVFFPLSLPIWGGVLDSWKVVDVQLISGVARLELDHLEYPDVHGHVSIDMKWGIAIEFVVPGQSILVGDLKSSLE